MNKRRKYIDSETVNKCEVCRTEILGVTVVLEQLYYLLGAGGHGHRNRAYIESCPQIYAVGHTPGEAQWKCLKLWSMNIDVPGVPLAKNRSKIDGKTLQRPEED